MTRALGLMAVGLALVVLAAPAARAGGRYGSFGVQMGVYRYPPPGGYAPGGHHFHHHRAYSAPAGYGHGYAPAYGHAPVMMMAPAAGCSGVGYAPRMAAVGGCSGSGYGYSYGHAFGPVSPVHGYADPQAGLLTFGGGLLEALEFARRLRTKIDEFDGGGGGGSAATKKEIADLRKDIEALRAEVKAINVPPNLGAQLTEINSKLDAQRADIEGMKKALKEKLPGIVFP